jgi:UDP-N-acetylmuramoylalanine--D-glutamate ligase
MGLVERRTGKGGSGVPRAAALLVAAAELRLVGRHNALNASRHSLVSSVTKIDRSVLSALAEFEGLPHRMQRIAEAGDIVFVDDSKATTVAATQAALEGLAARWC